MPKYYLKLIFAFSFTYFSNALYEDQVGKFDWKQSYVGRVKYSHIDNVGERVYVATENNVVASINLNDGTLVWRKVLETGESGKIVGFSVGNEVVTLSGSGPVILRGWNPKSGLLSHEWIISGESSSEWTMDSSKVYQVKLSPGSVKVLSYHIKTGNPVANAPKTISAPWLTEGSDCVVDKGFVLCVTPDLSAAYGLSLSNSTLAVAGKIPLLSGDNTEASLTTVASLYPSAVLGSTSGERKVVFTLIDNTLLTQVTSKCVSHAVRKIYKEPALICASHNKVVYELQSQKFSESLDNSQIGSALEILHNTPLPMATISSITELSSDPYDSVLLLVGDDDSLIFVEKDKVKWIREEALANVVTAEMVDLPISDEEAAIEKEFANKEVDKGFTSGITGMFWRRIHSQALQLVNLFMNVFGLKQSSEDAILGLKKDQFGLNKLLILITKSSKLYGMESVRGNIMWQVHLEGVTPHTALGEMSVPFFLHRNSRHFSLPSVASLILKQKNSDRSALYTFNPINGQPLYGGMINLDYKVKQMVQLPKEDNEFIRGLLLVSENDAVQVFPDSSRQTALEILQSLYVFTINPEEGLLEGYTFTQTKPKQVGVVKVWNVHLSPPIVSVGIKNKAERVHSQGRVLGDRSVLYKYINPHLIAVATYNTDPIHKNIVTVFLVDTVNGAVVFSSVHKRAVPPVFIVHSENWVVYSFYNDKSRRTEVISLDLYEGKSQRNSTDFSSVTAISLEPFIERQAYIFPHNVMAMRETITEKGITNKHLLVGVSTGSVIEVPWALLDPHRSPDGREEGVIPYTPDLSLPPEAILTYNHTLPQISGIHTSPSGLESTSLVLIYGLDLFFTRVAPSKTFDVLKDDFEYWLITLVLGGLITAAYISKRLASRKALRQAWK